MPTKLDRVMVNIPRRLKSAIEARARADGRSVANYIAKLITDALPEVVEEPTADYGKPHVPNVRAAIKRPESHSPKRRTGSESG